MVRASTADLRTAGSVRGQLPFAPSRESTQFTNRSASTSGMPRTNENARFFSRTQGAQVNRVPFETQRQSFSSPPAGRNANTPAGNAGGWRGAGSPAPANNNSGWQRFNPGSNPGQGSRPQVSPNTPRNNGNIGNSGNSGSSGWQRMDGNRGGYNTPQPPQSRGGYNAPESRGGYNQAPSYNRNYTAPREQPQMRVSPPIIQNRGNSGGGAPRGNSGGGGSRGGGGGSRGSSGGGGNHG